MAPVKLRGRGSMYAAAGPSPAPPSPWQPAHHLTYTFLPAVVSCAARERGAGSGTVPAATTSVTRSSSARSVMTAPCLTAPCSLSFLPRPRLPPRLLIQEQNDRPDLPLGEEVLPHRHRRVPRRALTGEAGPALGDPPEHEALGELRDRAVVLEVRGERVEAGREVSLAVEVIAMTRETVPVVDVLALREICGEGVGVLPQRVLESRQRDRLAPKRDLGGRRGVDRTQVRRRRDARRDLAVGDESDQRGHPREHHRAHQLEPRLDEHRPDRLLEAKRSEERR